MWWEPFFSIPLKHTQGIVYNPISLINMAYYSLMTSLTQGSSRPCRVGDESFLSIQPSREQQARSGEPNLILHLSHQMWFNMDTDDWLNTAMLLNVKVTNPVPVLSSRLMTQLVTEWLVAYLMLGALPVPSHMFAWVRVNTVSKPKIRKMHLCWGLASFMFQAYLIKIFNKFNKL